MRAARSRRLSGDGVITLTTASAPPGIPRRSSAPSDSSVDVAFRIPSTTTLGFAAVVIAAHSVALGVGVAFSGELTDLDWGSWEGSLPESSSLGGDGIPLRGAFIRFRPGFKNSLRGKLYQLCGAGDIFIAINSWRLGPFWSAEMAHSFAATDSLSLQYDDLMSKRKDLQLVVGPSAEVHAEGQKKRNQHLKHGRRSLRPQHSEVQ